MTKSGFGFLNATHLNEIIGALNQVTAGGFTIPCIDTGVLLDVVVGAYQDLRARFDVVICEGAGGDADAEAVPEAAAPSAASDAGA